MMNPTVETNSNDGCLATLRCIEFERKRRMDSFLKNIIGQDQQDRQDNAAFG